MPPEQRYWPEPRHAVWVEHESHLDANVLLACAMQAEADVAPAVQPLHDVVLIGGSLATPLIAFNQVARTLAALNE